MKIACIGGGPAGLYLGILVKRVAPEHDVVIYERNRPDDTFGFGVVFSDATLGNLAAADPDTHAQITSKFARWDDIAIEFVASSGQRATLRSTGHGFCGLERKALLEILQHRATGLGVRVEFEHPVQLHEIAADVVVGCDGVASSVRDALAGTLEPDVDVRPNKFVWLGSTVPYDAFTFIFKTTPHGMFRVHAYRYHERGSTFIVECREPTWRAAGLDGADEDATVAILERIFADELGKHRLIKNKSIWRNFPTVRCKRWHAGNVVLVGDAAHTAHFSIGSGTKLAMEDVIVLRDELLANAADIPAALAAYEAKRRPEVEALQAAAQASLEWFEGTERYAKLSPIQQTYSLMTRSLRVSHVSVAKRDPELARGVERVLAASVGITSEPPPSPSALPFALGDRRVTSRIAVLGAPAWPAREIAGDEELVALGAAAAAGAGMVVTPPLPVTIKPDQNVASLRGTAPRINTDEQAVAWARIAEFVHGKGSRIAARISTVGAVAGALEAAVQRAAFANFDLVLLDAGDDPIAREHLPAMVATARAAWRKTGWIAACVTDRANARAAVVAAAAQLVRAGANLLWVSADDDARAHNARLPAAPLADRLRNELGVATALVAEASTTLPDLDAALGAGRTDLVARVA